MESIFPPFSERLLSEIKKSTDVAVIGHENPDGDCIFSSLALSEILKAMGKSVTLFNQGPFSRPEIKEAEGFFKSTVDGEYLAKDPLVVVVDCSTEDRPGEIFKRFSKQRKIVLDHHSSGIPFTDEDLMYIVPTSPSTTLVLEKLREALGVGLSKDMATYLYKGFATDSGFFHFLGESVASEVFSLVSVMTSAGVSPYEIYDEMHDGKSLGFMRTLSSVMGSTKSIADGRILYVVQSLGDGDEKVSDVLYDLLLQVEGVKVVINYKEKEDKIVVGFRSKHKSGIDVGRIASSFGGGGHMHASGASIEKSLDEAIKSVNGEVERIVCNL